MKLSKHSGRQTKIKVARPNLLELHSAQKRSPQLNNEFFDFKADFPKFRNATMYIFDTLSEKLKVKSLKTSQKGNDSRRYLLVINFKIF